MECEVPSAGAAASIILERERRRHTDSAAIQSPLHELVRGAQQRNNDNERSTSPTASTFSLASVAKFSTWGTETMQLDVRGRPGQLRDPDFVSSTVLSRALYAPSSTFVDSPVVVDILSIQRDTDRQMTQQSSGQLCCGVSFEVRTATVNSHGLAFGVVTEYPYREAVRVRLLLPKDSGGIDRHVLASCLEHEPLYANQKVLMTVSACGIRVQCNSPRPARGVWERKHAEEVINVAVDDKDGADDNEKVDDDDHHDGAPSPPLESSLVLAQDAEGPKAVVENAVGSVVPTQQVVELQFVPAGDGFHGVRAPKGSGRKRARRG